MDLEIREMKMFDELIAKKAEADLRLGKIRDRSCAFSSLILFVVPLIVVVWFALAFFSAFEFEINVIDAAWIGLAIFIASIFLFILIPKVAARIRIMAAKNIVFGWWEEAVEVSLKETQHLFDKLLETDPYSDERLELTYHCMTRQAARRTIFLIIDSLRADFKTKIPDKVSFYLMVQDELVNVSGDMGDAEEPPGAFGAPPLPNEDYPWPYL